LNKAKGNREVLDPFEVGRGWFRLDIGLLRVIPTDAIPPERRAIAEETARRLCNNDVIVRIRREAFEEWRAGRTPLERLDRYDPLLSSTIREELAAGGEERLRRLTFPDRR
jgi:hypothetical protein